MSGETARVVPAPPGEVARQGRKGASFPAYHPEVRNTRSLLWAYVYNYGIKGVRTGPERTNPFLPMEKRTQKRNTHNPQTPAIP